MTNIFKKNFMKVPNIPVKKLFQEVGRNAFVDWILILLVNVSTAIVLVLGGVYLYWLISSGNFRVNTATEAKEEGIFDMKSFNTVLKEIENREDNSERIKMGYRGPSDPSL